MLQRLNAAPAALRAFVTREFRLAGWGSETTAMIRFDPFATRLGNDSYFSIAVVHRVVFARSETLHQSSLISRIRSV